MFVIYPYVGDNHTTTVKMVLSVRIYILYVDLFWKADGLKERLTQANHPMVNM